MRGGMLVTECQSGSISSSRCKLFSANSSILESFWMTDLYFMSFGTTMNVAKPPKGFTATVFSVGVVGLSACEGAKFRGASRIFGVNLNPDMFEMDKNMVKYLESCIGSMVQCLFYIELQ